ncbi:hypothetical protein, partial [Escherichia coli]|uniref:hypothetical protein n=1 Tax=Escherichia coli TaxID=562 RepID=UPI001BC83583
ADRNRSHWSTSKTPSYTKSVSWQHHPGFSLAFAGLFIAITKATSYRVALIMAYTLHGIT